MKVGDGEKYIRGEGNFEWLIRILFFFLPEWKLANFHLYVEGFIKYGSNILYLEDENHETLSATLLPLAGTPGGDWYALAACSLGADGNDYAAALAAVLVIGAKSGLCNVVAMVIPLALFRVLLFVGEFFRRKDG